MVQGLSDVTLLLRPLHVFQSPLDGRRQARQVALEHVVCGPVSQGVDGVFLADRPRHEDKWNIRQLLVRNGQGGHAIEQGHAEVREDDVRLELLQRLPKGIFGVHAQADAVQP